MLFRLFLDKGYEGGKAVFYERLLAFLNGKVGSQALFLRFIEGNEGFLSSLDKTSSFIQRGLPHHSFV
jgi:hypothetical protein